PDAAAALAKSYLTRPVPANAVFAGCENCQSCKSAPFASVAGIYEAGLSRVASGFANPGYRIKSSPARIHGKSLRSTLPIAGRNCSRLLAALSLALLLRANY